MIKRLLAASACLALSMCQETPASAQQINASASAPISVSTATTTVLVALSGTKAIYISHFDFIALVADNVTIEYGTGTACASGTTALTGAYPAGATGGISVGAGVGVVAFVPAGNALCIVTSAGTQLSGLVSYAQY